MVHSVVWKDLSAGDQRLVVASGGLWRLVGLIGSDQQAPKVGDSQQQVSAGSKSNFCTGKTDILFTVNVIFVFFIIVCVAAAGSVQCIIAPFHS